MSLTLTALASRTTNVRTIWQKELRSYFNSAMAYVVIVVFLSIVGWFFTSSLFLVNIASMRVVFEIIPTVFMFVIPAITMRLLSEERKSGTLELLTTKPLYDIEIVLGKFLGAWTLIAVALVPTLVYFGTLAFLGEVDTGPVIGGYLGLMLMAGVYIAFGLLASSLTDNQVVAFILGFLFIFALFMLDKVLVYVPEWMASEVEYLGVDYHFSGIARGVIDTRNIVYFVSAQTVALLLATLSLERRKW
jgi:ABC-2 type transport system permease protein